MKRLSLTKPHLLIMTGIPGSGKTYFAEKFSETFKAPFVSYYYLAGQLKDEQSADTASLYMLGQMMKTGQSIIFEGKTDTRKERVELAHFARAEGYEPLFVWVQTDQPTAKTRSAKRSKTSTHRQLEAETHDRLTKNFRPLTASEKHVVISGKHTYATQAKVVLTKLSSPRAAISTHTQPPARSEAPGRRNISIG